MSDQRRSDAEILAAFRAVTGWTDEDVLHYASCGNCVPVCGTDEENCPASPHAVAEAQFVKQRTQRLAEQASRRKQWAEVPRTHGR